MTKTVRLQAALIAAFALSGGVALAEATGETVYVARCQSCHGKAGLAETSLATIMKVKPVNDPEAKKLTEAQMIEITTDGKNKMQGFKGKISEQQIKEAVEYFRSLAK